MKSGAPRPLSFRVVTLLALAGLSSAAATVGVACSATDPGAIDYKGPLPVPNGDATTVVTSDTDAGDTTDPDGAAGDDATTATGDDGGTSTTYAAFVGATAFQASQTPLQTAAEMAGANHVGFPDGGDPFSQECLSCHYSAGTAKGDPWIIGGSVATAAGGKAPASPVEVRVVGPDGGEVAFTYTDVEGNFWVYQNGDAGVPAGSHVGVRNATTTMEMSETISTGDCNSAGCHVAAMPIYLP